MHAPLQQFQAMMARMRADPQLAKVLDNPRIKAALQAVQQDPRALAQFQQDGEVMAVLGRLLESEVGPAEVEQFRDLDTTPSELVTAIAREDVMQLLAAPKVRQALADIRADPVSGMSRWQHDAQVMAALDKLQAVLHAPGSDEHPPAM
jgi:hypothetical protein